MLLITITMNNLWKASLQQATQKWDDDHVWSPQEWKTDTEMNDDGTAQSVVNEVMPRDRPGRRDVGSQKGAWPQFVIGNDEAELELSVESRSFVNRVNDQVRKRQKRISNVTEDEEKHFMIW